MWRFVNTDLHIIILGKILIKYEAIKKLLLKNRCYDKIIIVYLYKTTRITCVKGFYGVYSNSIVLNDIYFCNILNTFCKGIN